MSMWAPMEPNLGREDDGIPAADPGAGAPPPADGFGVGGEEPERLEEDARPAADEEDARPAADGGVQHADPPPFRTPDPAEVSREGR
ncbi:hypothetical protein E4P41_05550 [Geodermatophilus sp. DF01-2]|uniref:hypothetical protein n=1 Tax=Geodermatophilus sp. DF01-2 TaxID=2559610 RepID=UPI001073D961|nr:hypothetical protein [Geodermatophilus sp. DF01_2]TFV63150.1 hypothetical protein E4P41_05550 [Geodermatophilus sp. DF01_2]